MRGLAYPRRRISSSNMLHTTYHFEIILPSFSFQYQRIHHDIPYQNTPWVQSLIATSFSRNSSKIILLNEKMKSSKILQVMKISPKDFNHGLIESLCLDCAHIVSSEFYHENYLFPGE
jgi:hypothetical protein